jgi:hypothetical protein
MKTDEWGEPFEAAGSPVGETAAEMVGTINRMVRNERNHTGRKKPRLKAEGPVHKEQRGLPTVVVQCRIQRPHGWETEGVRSDL